MAYLSATADFIPRLPQSAGTFTGSSMPLSVGAVASLLEEFSLTVDGAAAAAGYAVPVSSTATSAFAQMGQIVRHGAAWEVLRTIFPGQSGQGDRASVADDYRIAYENAVRALRRGELALVGAASSSGDGGRVLPRSAETGSLVAAEDSGIVPLAQTGMEF